MRPRYVVDTNVLIAASAGDPQQHRSIAATPEDPALRLAVWQWLKAFKESDSRLVLDGAGRIFEEYRHQLGFGDYGHQVVLHKWSTCASDVVEIAYDADGNAVLPADLQPVVHDLADRKMVAACAEAIRVHGACWIAFAGDTDWHGWEQALSAHGIPLEPVIEAWSRQKYAEKEDHGPRDQRPQHHRHGEAPDQRPTWRPDQRPDQRH
jgi:hypothetical protein